MFSELSFRIACVRRPGFQPSLRLRAAFHSISRQSLLKISGCRVSPVPRDFHRVIALRARCLSITRPRCHPSVDTSVLTEEDKDVGEYLYRIHHASTRAAMKDDPRILRAILQLGLEETNDRDLKWSYSANAIIDGPSSGVWRTPLLQTVMSRKHANVETLLEFGADPNGIDMINLEEHATWFFRFRNFHVITRECFPSEEWKDDPIHFKYPQLAPLTEEELQRRRQGFHRFWTTQELLPLAFHENGDAMLALVAAAKVGDVAIFDRLVEAGADTSFWKPPLKTQLPTPRTPSSIALSSPIYAAVAHHQHSMLVALLARGFDPNVQPLISPNHAYTPLMACVIEQNADAFLELIRHELSQPNTRTPIYKLHFLHFVAARQSIRFLSLAMQHVSLSSAGLTALGQSMLHIACLPLMPESVNIYSEKSFISVHDVRDVNTPSLYLVHTSTDTRRSLAYCYWGGDKPVWPAGSPPDCNNPGSGDINAQWNAAAFQGEEFIGQLVATDSQDVLQPDYHGNNPLHYLASHRKLLERSIELLRQMPGGKEAWEICRNHWGFTAKEIYEDNKGANIELEKSFWPHTPQWDGTP